MLFGEIKCPNCNEIIDNSTIEICRKNIQNEDTKILLSNEPIYVCQNNDNIFLKCFCTNCNKKFHSMLVVDVKPIKCYSASSRDDLVIIKE